MGAITITAADVRLVRGGDEHLTTLPVGEAFTAGKYIRLNPTTGYLELGKATTQAEVGKGYLAIGAGVVGMPATGASRPCYVDLGSALSGLSFGDPVYLGDTDGLLQTTAGTIEVVVGVVVPGFADTTGKKLLEVTLGDYVAEPEGS